VTNEPQNSIMTPEQIQLMVQLESIFMPYSRRQRDTLYKDENSKTRFVHYTSAEAALNIIRNKRMWMRNTTCMSDYSEVQHGVRILRTIFSDEATKKEFSSALDACSPNIATEAISIFDHLLQDILLNTYISSVSEHDDNEDLHGRLSMWRAFGGNTTRVAIVISVPWFSGGSQALNLMFSPVAYLKEDEVHAEFKKVIKNIQDNCDFLRSVDRSVVVSQVFHTLLAGVTCLKHEGFREEREWRVIYAPRRTPSPLMEHSIEIIGGIPQPVYKMPLDVKVSPALADLDISRLFDHLIIGPSPYPWVVYQAFVEELTKAGVPEAEKRVRMSGIPIRS